MMALSQLRNVVCRVQNGFKPTEESSVTYIMSLSLLRKVVCHVHNGFKTAEECSLSRT